ncbi:MAG: sigma-70 family RNA polymerase sigma factor, partial [bacterium]|nr:sigma-70 family RNA polymerase sigma factor [bacterium]
PTSLHRVPTTACLDELRRRQRRSADELTDRLSGGPLDPVGEQISARLDLDAALAELPEEFRVPVVLRGQARLSYDEISDVLHIPPGTVRSRIARGRRRLAETLSAGNQTPASDRLNGD